MQLEKLEGMDATPLPKISKAEMLKMYLAIDREFLKNRKVPLQGLGNADMGAVDDALANMIKSDITDSEIEEMHSEFVQSDIQALSGGDLGRIKAPKVLKRVTAAVKKTAVKTKTAVKKVASTVTAATKKAVSAVVKVAKLPAKLAVEGVLKVFSGKAAGFFLYALIPDSNPILKKHPKVAAKRKSQLSIIDAIAKGTQLDKSYIMKHLNNGLAKAYGTDAGTAIVKLSKGTLSGLDGLGVIPPEAIEVAIQVVAKILPGILKNFNKQDTPAAADFEKEKAADVAADVAADAVLKEAISKDNGESDGSGDPDKGSFSDILFSPMGFLMKLPLVAWGASQLDYSNTETLVVSSLLGAGILGSGIFSFFKK